jgi:hypothetical protein
MFNQLHEPLKSGAGPNTMPVPRDDTTAGTMIWITFFMNTVAAPRLAVTYAGFDSGM